MIPDIIGFRRSLELHVSYHFRSGTDTTYPKFKLKNRETTISWTIQNKIKLEYLAWITMIYIVPPWLSYAPEGKIKRGLKR